MKAWKNPMNSPLIFEGSPGARYGKICTKFTFLMTLSVYSFRLSAECIHVYLLTVRCTTISGLTPITSSKMYENLYQKMPYLRQRMTQLAPLTDALDPYEPVRVVCLHYNIIFHLKSCDIRNCCLF